MTLTTALERVLLPSVRHVAGAAHRMLRVDRRKMDVLVTAEAAGARNIRRTVLIVTLDAAPGVDLRGCRDLLVAFPAR